MPTKNVVKVFIPNAYYHVYNRGWNLGKIFTDGEDLLYFENLLTRYLSPEHAQDRSGMEYRHFYPDVHLLAYCLMGNHFHMLLHQYDDEAAITHLMTSLATAYTAYFNKRHDRRGSLFESTYKSVVMTNDSQLQHITRYIHLNHSRYKTWPHSSYRDYLEGDRPWIDTEPILSLFTSRDEYRVFVEDYEETQRERDEIKRELYGR